MNILRNILISLALIVSAVSAQQSIYDNEYDWEYITEDRAFDDFQRAYLKNLDNYSSCEIAHHAIEWKDQGHVHPKEDEVVAELNVLVVCTENQNLPDKIYGADKYVTNIFPERWTYLFVRELTLFSGYQNLD